MMFKERLVIRKTRFTNVRLVTTLTMAFVATLVALVSPNIAAAAGTHLDQSFMFGTGKKNFSFGSSSADEAQAVAIQPDGKIVIAGRTNANGTWDFAIARFWPDGAPDSSFDGDGLATIDFGGAIDSAYAVAIQSDGKIVVAGESIVLGANENFAVARLTEFGIPDSTFDGDGRATYDFQGQNDVAYGMAIQPDGKIILVGYAGMVSRDWGMLRITTGGLPDATFGTNGRVTTDFGNQIDVARGVVVMPDNKIVVAGTAVTSDGSDFGLARYTSGGLPDTSFQSGGKLLIEVDRASLDEVKVLKKTADGKLVIGGETTTPNGLPKLAVVRCSSEGVLDNTFDGDGRFIKTFNSANNNFLNGLAVNAAGEIAIAARVDGGLGNSGFSVVRLLSNGKLDSRFGAGGRATTVFGLSERVANDVTFQPDGKIVAVGTVRGFLDMGVARYTSLGIAAASDFDGDGVADIGVFRPSEGIWYLQNSVTGVKTYVRFGLIGDQVAPGDYDGDGKTDVAVFRPSNGTWYVLRSSDGQMTVTTFGLNSDMPVPGDYDGDGKTDIAVYRLSNATWYLLQSKVGFEAIKFGSDIAFPVQGDYDGDGRTDQAVYRPGDKTWWVRGSFLNPIDVVQFGANNDLSMPADYDGDGVTDIGVFRNDGNWWIRNSQTETVATLHWGQAFDVTTPADFDGDGRADLAVFRASTGVWYISNPDGTYRSILWGIQGDVPLAGITNRIFA